MFRYALAPLLLIAGLAPAHAAIYKVGPGGTHATIQAAIHAALANPGNDEIRVHTGTYAESLTVPATMTSDQLDIVGGYGDGYSLTVRNGAALTIIEPPDGSAGANLAPAGGIVQLESVTISGAHTASCAGFNTNPSGDAQVYIEYSFVTGNVVDAGGNVAHGAGGCLNASGKAIAVLYYTTVSDNVARVNSGSNGAFGGGVSSYCADEAQCGISFGIIRHNRVEPLGGWASGAGVDADVNGQSLFSAFATQFAEQEVGGTPSVGVGSAIRVVAGDTAVAEIARCRFHASGATAYANTEELALAATETAKLYFDNSVVAQSGLRSFTATAYNDADVRLAQLTLADNAYPAKVQGLGNTAVLVYDDIFNGADANVSLDGVVAAQHNLVGTDPHFVAPSLFDYSLVGGASPAVNAGSTTLDSGIYDVDGADRIQDGVVDIGASESSDRIFANRIDD